MRLSLLLFFRFGIVVDRVFLKVLGTVESKDQLQAQGEYWLFWARFGIRVRRELNHVRIKVHFKDSKGNLIKTVEANEGDDLLAVAHEYDIDLEGM